MFSNIHKAYGDDSVFQILVDYDGHVADGEQDSIWRGYNKIRAVKNSDGRYEVVIRDAFGQVLYEGHLSYKYPVLAIEAGISIYKGLTLSSVL